MTREDWLESAVEHMRPLYSLHGRDVPRVRVAIGWPSTGALAKKARRLGECWTSGPVDGVQQIYVSPLLAGAVEVLDVLAHELCHAALKPGVGHRMPFRRLGESIGLVGKPASMRAGRPLLERLNAIAGELPEWPGAAIVPGEKARKPQTGRMLKVECPGDACRAAGDGKPYIARITRVWVDVCGTPICPACKRPMELEGDSSREDEGEG